MMKGAVPLGEAAPKHRPRHFTACAIARVQVLGHQSPGEACGAKDDQVERSWHGVQVMHGAMHDLHSGLCVGNGHVDMPDIGAGALADLRRSSSSAAAKPAAWAI
jgi:hypothetical protein